MLGRLHVLFGKLSNSQCSRYSPALREAQLRYLASVQELVRASYPVLTRPEVLEIEHFIHHDELSEALLTLARIIAEKKAMVPRSTIESIRSLIDGFAESKFLPPNLDEFALD